jgi:cardiolipin synthase
MLSAITHARHHVQLETYMFRQDVMGQRFAQALCDAAQRGVDVYVLYDWMGSFGTPRAFFRRLRQGGVRVKAFRPLAIWRIQKLFHRDHRKLLLVDGHLAFVGGLNIGDFWAPAGQGGNWRDDVLRIEGPAVQALERRFWATWRSQREKGRPERNRRVPPKAHRERGPTSLVVLSSRRAIHRAYLRALRRAKRSIRIAAAYFVPDRLLMSALIDAASRGVEVSLLMAGRSDLPFMTSASRAFYETLLQAGVRIFEWNSRVLHAKTAVVDGHWGTLGSFNLEKTSLTRNHEVNVFFDEPHLAAALDRNLQGDLQQSREIRLSLWKLRPFYQRLWEKLVSRLIHLF